MDCHNEIDHQDRTGEALDFQFSGYIMNTL